MSKTDLAETANGIEASCSEIVAHVNAFTTIVRSGTDSVQSVLDRVDTNTKNYEKDVHDLLKQIDTFNDLVSKMSTSFKPLLVNKDLARSLRSSVKFSRALLERDSRDDMPETLVRRMAMAVISNASAVAEEINSIVASVRLALSELRSQGVESEQQDAEEGESTSPRASDDEADVGDQLSEDDGFIVNDDDAEDDDEEAKPESSESEEEGKEDDSGEENDAEPTSKLVYDEAGVVLGVKGKICNLSETDKEIFRTAMFAAFHNFVHSDGAPAKSPVKRVQ